MEQPMVNKIAHGRRGLSYEEGIALLPLLFPEDQDASEGDETAAVEEALRRAHQLGAALVAELCRRIELPAEKASVLQELFASSFRAGLSLEPADPMLDANRLADIFVRARPAQ
jgi:hypothetical protein